MRPDPEFYLQDPPVDPGPFFEMIDNAVDGMRKLLLILASLELGIFDYCSEPRDAVELAQMTGGNTHLIALTCDALAGVGLVIRDGTTYRNSPAAMLFLTGNSPYTQIHYIRDLGRHVRDLWVPLADIIRNGPVTYNRELFFREYSLPAMADNAVSGRLQGIVRAVHSLPGFFSFRRMIDLGGGHGLYAIALAALNPDLEAYVFDLPLVIPQTNAYIAKFGTERVHAVPGDFFVDDFGKGYDLILSSSNPSGKSPGLLPVIAGALEEGGYFVNVQSPGGLQNNPLQVLEWDLWTFLAVDKSKGGFSKDQMFMTAEYRAAMAAEGLVPIISENIRDIYHGNTWVNLVISRKTDRPGFRNEQG
ncbi:MAG TPA: methyltransferase [Methanoregulaceae archaeon]|nr:methyltransferase [Methanoregulaceae archaeon]